MGLGYCPTEFVHTNAMLVLNRNRYDYKFSDKNNTYLSGVLFYGLLVPAGLLPSLLRNRFEVITRTSIRIVTEIGESMP